MPIPPNSDIVYHIDVLECKPSLKKGHVAKKKVPKKTIFAQKQEIETAKAVIKSLKKNIVK